MRRVTMYQEFSSKSSYEISEEIVQHIKQQLSRYSEIELLTISDGRTITEALIKANEDKSDLFITLNVFQDSNDIIEKSNKGMILLDQNNRFVVDFANVMNDTLEDNTKEYIYDYKDIIFTKNEYVKDSIYVVVNNIDKEQDTFSIAMDIVDGLVELYRLHTKKESKKNIKDNTKYHVLILGSTIPIITTIDKYVAISACNAYIGGKVVTSDGVVVHRSTSTKYIV
nr:MAG TPA: hypothetical protein [Caudoviricetes sp.]